MNHYLHVFADLVNLQSLIKLPAKISQSDLVLDFFEPTNEDIASMEPESAEQYVNNITFIKLLFGIDTVCTTK